MRHCNGSLFPRSEERCSKGAHQNAPSATQDVHAEQRATAKTQKQLRKSCCNSFMVRPCLQQTLKTGSLTGFDAVVPAVTSQQEESNPLGARGFSAGSCMFSVCLRGFCPHSVHFLEDGCNAMEIWVMVRVFTSLQVVQSKPPQPPQKQQVSIIQPDLI